MIIKMISMFYSYARVKDEGLAMALEKRLRATLHRLKAPLNRPPQNLHRKFIIINQCPLDLSAAAASYCLCDRIGKHRREKSAPPPMAIDGDEMEAGSSGKTGERRG